MVEICSALQQKEGAWIDSWIQCVGTLSTCPCPVPGGQTGNFPLCPFQKSSLVVVSFSQKLITFNKTGRHYQTAVRGVTSLFASLFSHSLFSCGCFLLSKEQQFKYVRKIADSWTFFEIFCILDTWMTFCEGSAFTSWVHAHYTCVFIHKYGKTSYSLCILSGSMCHLVRTRCQVLHFPSKHFIKYIFHLPRTHWSKPPAFEWSL